MSQHNIINIIARQVLDSRGTPTVEADVILQNGTIGRASVPSGASTGDKEALELRDRDVGWCGKGVSLAVNNIHQQIKPALIGKSVLDIALLDKIMLELDGTDNKGALGANAILAVSLASVQAGSQYQKKPLFEYIVQDILKKDYKSYCMPIPMMNILNGGSHADNTVDFQEFMIMPINFSSYTNALQAGTEIFHALKSILYQKKLSTTIGDEGGFAPMLNSNAEALELILEAIILAKYKPGKDVFLALDVAASEFYDNKKNVYYLESENRTLKPLELVDYYQELCEKYPIISIEDGLDQNDWDAWKQLNATLGQEIQIVGDDLTVTNPSLLSKAIDEGAMNAILIKLNQIGTFTETLNAIQLAQKHNFGTIISHRSGETENTFIADLAVAAGAGQIKTGSLCRTDRTAKYNQLLRIAETCSIKNNLVIYGNIQSLNVKKNLQTAR
ncbi:MAG: phosphopyruvate hydratase [Candidatus Marinimicrobia bacterium]|nr:phosphopyruvate hydratase [Candidatus Neomarinimicrobiota bacterium]